ncbi:MAG: adenylate/guanylate cyclase domain-containing protein, partial [Calditrichia bacterium]|nr:adenylate/guanylate cyclase domain-containing protein [Calditrichia bacterium]
SRAKLAQIMKKMSDAGTEIIGCDFLFAGYRDNLEDKQLIETFREAGIVIVPYQAGFSGSGQGAVLNEAEIKEYLEFETFSQITRQEALLPEFNGFQNLPIIELLENAYAGGYANLLYDEDGILRRYPLVAKFDNKIIPSFPLIILSSFLDYDLKNIEVSKQGNLILKSIKLPDSNSEQDIVIPLDKQGYMIINFTGKLNDTNYPNSFSASDLLAIEDVSALEPQLSGKIGILSDISSAGKDFCNIPLENNFPNSFLYSNIITNILKADFIRETDDFINIICISLLLLIITIFCIGFRMIWFVTSTMIMILIYYFANIYVFIEYSILLPMFPIMIPVVLVSVFSMLYKYLYEAKHHQWVETSLTSYISAPLLKKMHRNPSLLKPGGERKRISILFSDIAGFTSFCDTSEPEDVQDFLEIYYKNMANIVFQNNGIIDKYLGDGLLAFFENEEEEIISAENAIKTAIQMQTTAEKLKLKLDRKIHFELHIRFGITTGYAAVGNIGPKEKLDYTVIGSKVNLASRLQS